MRTLLVLFLVAIYIKNLAAQQGTLNPGHRFLSAFPEDYNCPAEATCAILYERCDFQGKQLCICKDVEVADFARTRFRDVHVHSIKVPDGFLLHLYKSENKQGDKTTFSTDHECLEQPYYID